MRKISLAVVCVATVLSIQVSSASARTPIHFIYAKTDATYEQFQSDRDNCAKAAERHFMHSVGLHYYIWRPSSTVFLNCMTEKGYTLDNALGANGWDTGVLWTL